MRQRGNCVIKKRPSEDLNEDHADQIEEDTTNEIIVENDRFKKDKKFINRQSLRNFKDSFVLNLKKPVFKNLKKEFFSMKQKVDRIIIIIISITKTIASTYS